MADEGPKPLEPLSKAPTPDADKIVQGIAVGTFLAGVYFLDKLLADEKYVKDENGNWVNIRKGLFDELFE